MYYSLRRLGVFPTWIIYSLTVEAPQLLEMFPIYYIFNGMLSLLLVLHVFWTYFIFKIAYKALNEGSGKTGGDSRSDSNDISPSSSDHDDDGDLKSKSKRD